MLYNHCIPIPSLIVGIVKYMLRQTGPSSKLLESALDVTKFAPDTEARAVAFLGEGRGLEAYTEAGNDLRVVLQLGHCTDRQVAQSMGYETGFVVVFHSR